MEVVYLSKTEKFIEYLEPILKNKVIVMIDMLEECGNLLGMPFSKSLGGGLYELRIVGNDHVRIFYCFQVNKAYLLHGIIKKSLKIPQKDIDYARRIQKMLALI